VKSTLPDDGESRRKGSNGSEETTGLNDGESRRRTEERRAGSEEERGAAGRISGEGADGAGNDGESAETEKILRRGATAEARAPPPRRRSTHDVCKQYPVLAAAATDGSRK
jgi:hypothetical protein